MLGLKKKKKKYYFCFNCANIIRIGIRRGENHKKRCTGNFKNSECKYCGLFFAKQLTYTDYRGRSVHNLRSVEGSDFPKHLIHDTHTCFFKNE